MICGRCRRPMIQGDFKMEQHSIDKGIYYAYPMAAWYKDGTKYCETPQDSTLGYYRPDCGLLVGVFTTTRPTGGFVGKFAADLDENVDILPSKICPDCGMEMDIDYPRCPTCGYVFETK